MTKKQVKKGGENEKEPDKPATEPVAATETKDSEPAAASDSGFWSKLFGTSTEANEVVKEKDEKEPTTEDKPSTGVLDTVKGWFKSSNDDIKLTGGMRKKTKKTKTKLRKRALKSKRSRI